MQPGIITINNIAAGSVCETKSEKRLLCWLLLDIVVGVVAG